LSRLAQHDTYVSRQTHLGQQIRGLQTGRGHRQIARFDRSCEVPKNVDKVSSVVTGSEVVEASRTRAGRPAASWFSLGNQLARLLDARTTLDRQIVQKVHESRDAGMTWAMIADRLGVTVETARRLWGPYPRPSWHKLPLP